jgi:hypothetical protein
MKLSRDWNCLVQATPPLRTKETFVQSADIGRSAEPVSLDRLDQKRHGLGDGHTSH